MQHFTVSICTAKRPVMLHSALSSIRDLSVPLDSTLSVVVIENDSECRSKDIVDTIFRSTKIPVRYISEPRIGIPFARNRAIEAALVGYADWIAMLDDDERVQPDWLVQLHAACQKFDAKVASGPVLQVFDVAPPHWWKSISQSSHITGSRLRVAYTNNVLFHSSLVKADRDGLNLRFDERFIFGAEDEDFFQRAHLGGVKMVWAEEALVVEQVPASRVCLRRALDRALMIGASGTLLKVIRKGRRKTWINTFPHVLRRLLLGVFYVFGGLLIWPANRLEGKR